MKIKSVLLTLLAITALIFPAALTAPHAFASIDDVAGNISESSISYDGATSESGLLHSDQSSLSGMIMPGLNNVNIRSEAWGDIIGKACSEQAFEITGEDGDWYIVNYNGRKAYILKQAMTTDKNIKSNSTAEFAPAPGKVRNCVALNVRTGPWGDKIGWLKDGDRVQITGEDGDWYKIKFGKRTGFVYKKYIGVYGGGRITSTTGAIQQTTTGQPVDNFSNNNNGGTAANTNTQTATDPNIASSGNRLIDWLRQAGFKGEGLRIAWAIAMRESNGIPEIGKGHKYFNGFDWGLFQLNKPTFGKRAWWDDAKMVDAIYNAKVVYDLSKGGTFWVPWGLSGDGKSMNVSCYKMWSAEKQMNCIWKPFKKWYDKYPLK
ncbi:MAG TPA: SH3 domain-containing protein [Candidatus Wallbacteria bacterium]|nr:SH3 domain-containing protein [Candidatus Wallbacteria bacterium]